MSCDSDVREGWLVLSDRFVVRAGSVLESPLAEEEASARSGVRVRVGRLVRSLAGVEAFRLLRAGWLLPGFDLALTLVESPLVMLIFTPISAQVMIVTWVFIGVS